MVVYAVEELDDMEIESIINALTALEKAGVNFISLADEKTFPLTPINHR